MNAAISNHRINLQSRMFGGCKVLFGSMLILIAAQAQANDVPAGAAEAWLAPTHAAKKENPVKSDERSVARGRELYLHNCVPCHGQRGKGDGPAASALDRKPANHTDPKMWGETDGSLFWKITTGRGPMPSWESAFPEQDRWNLVNFVRTLAPKPASMNQPKGEAAP